jgi:hypothetical protein
VRIGDHGVEPEQVVCSIADGHLGAGPEAVERHVGKLPVRRGPVAPGPGPPGCLGRRTTRPTGAGTLVG